MLKDLFAPIGQIAGLVAALLAVGALLVATLTTAGLAAAHVALDNAPELPDTGVDVSEIGDLSAAVDMRASQPSVVVDGTGEIIGRFAAEERYEPFAVGGVPANVETVLLAAEDADFREHHGFDPTAIGRAMVRNAAAGEVTEGGSTLTQQLAKNLFIGAEDSIDRKLQELQVALDIEEHFTKDEILTAYANSAFLGNGAFGFEAAAKEYFAKPAADLTLSETAMLVGILPAPSARDPRQDYAAADAARKVVLHRVADVGAASPAEVDAALAEAPAVLDRRARHEAFPYYIDYVRRYLLDEVGMHPDELYRGGLRIETALNPALQYAARVAVAEHVPDDVGPDAAVAVVDVRTGLVPALVGGRNFDAAEVNLALGRDGAGTGRQPGSSFKPFVLAAALEQGYAPDQMIDAPETYLPRTVTDAKPVHNFSSRGYEPMSLIEVTVRSINTSYVALTEAVGARAVRDLATGLGVDHLPEHPGPSIGIGAYETSPLDMATAYAGFAADGTKVTVGPVVQILGPDGELYAHLAPDPTERPQVISKASARWVTSALAQNVERGTATRAQIGRPAAAKTGTSNDYKNAWLVGYTPQLSTAVWVGHPTSNESMYGVAGFSRVTGGSIPALIWHDVMAAAHQGVPVVDFAAPPPPPETATPLPGPPPPTPGT